ncbi:MAG: response regulator [Phycisphaerae bacterium]
MGKILVVEDDAHILRVTSLWITRHGYDVVQAVNGADAQAILREQPVDMVISDINMPVMGGLELLRFVRTEIDAVIPYILLSSRCDQEEIVESIASLNARLFPKPFVPSQLVAEIERLLGAATR